MPFGGESIGTAYVRIIADGDGLDDSIEKEFRKAEPKVKKAGEDHADAFDEGWRDEDGKNSDDRMREMVERMEKGDNKFKNLGEILGSDFWNGLSKEFENKTKSHALSSIITKNLQDDFRKSGGDFERLGNTIEHDFSRLVADAGKELEGLGHELDNNRGPMDRFVERTERIGSATSRIFGKGSRNDFVNIVGSFVGAIANIPTFVAKAAKGIGDLGEKFGELGKGSSELEGLAASGAEAGAGLAELATAGLASGVAIAIVAAIIPVAVSTLTLLLGVVDALIGSVGIGLVGALGILGAILAGPLALGIGVFALGLYNINKNSQALLTKTLKPLTDQFSRMGQVAGKDLLKDAVPAIKELTTGLKPLEPLVDRIAKSLGTMTLNLAKSINSDEFGSGITKLGKFAAPALIQLGNIIDHTLGGLGGLFVAAIPAAERFLHDMDNLTSKFSDFSNKAENQKGLERFFNRAYDSLTSLGHLLKDTTGLIAALAGAGQGSGDTIIDHLDEKVRDFTAYLKANPKVVANFFSDVTDFADSVGRATLGIIHLVDALDSPDSRKAAIFLFSAIEGGVKTSIFVVGLLGKGIRGIGSAFSGIGTAVHDFVGLMSDGLAIVADGLGYLLDGVGKVGGVFNKLIPGSHDFGKAARDAATDMHGLADSLHDFADSKPINIKPHVDTSEMEKLKGVAHTTDESLRILLGLPKISPKADAKPLIPVKTGIDSIIDSANKFNGMPGLRVKANKTQADAARLSLLLMQNQFIDANTKLGRTLKVKIDAAQAKLAGDIIKRVKDLFAGLHDKTVTLTVKLPSNAQLAAINAGRGATGGISMPGGQLARRFASGGIANFQQFISNGNTAAEAGREAIVPLDKPLGEVDPSVRYLAAVARGLKPSASSGNTYQLTVVTPTTNPRAVAIEAINALTAQAV